MNCKSNKINTTNKSEIIYQNVFNIHNYNLIANEFDLNENNKIDNSLK